MITKAEAVIITNHVKYLKDHVNEAHLTQTLNNLDTNIRAAAEQGRDNFVWNTGGASFQQEIESTLKANGFDVTYKEGTYIIKWELA